MLGILQYIFYEHQLKFAREQLRNLKSNQLTYITTAITATGVILGLPSHLPAPLRETGVCFLFPLVVIVPTWLMFYDKLRSISRTAAYCRVIEQVVFSHCTASILGWENDLTKFKETKRTYEAKPIEIKKEQIFTFGDYWVSCHFIFLFLCGLCFLLSGYSFLDYWCNTNSLPFVPGMIILLAYLAFFYTFFHTKKILGSFLYSFDSFEFNKYIWDITLDLKCGKEG